MVTQQGVPRDTGGMAGFGAKRKHVTLPTNFRSPRENRHWRYGHLTARFAP